MTPTAEQIAIVEAAQNTQDNLLVVALAGAAKTTTLELIASALPETEILSLCFNKKTALESEARMPQNVTSSTLNSLGHRVWSTACGRRLKIDSGKTYAITKAYIEQAPIEDREALYKNMSELMKLISLGKQSGYIPSNLWNEPPRRAKRLMGDEEFFEHIDHKLEPCEIDLIIAVTNVSISKAFEGECDYDDQLLMPTIFHGVFPRFPLVLIDEAQDLSSLNHAMLRRLGAKRLIAVGDANQAIYGFRGAHENSMDLLRQEFSMLTLTLSTSFRCARAIVEHARWKAPSMAYPSWAREGIVEHKTSWSTSDLVEDAAILCRNNAPLFSTAIRLLKNGRAAELGGKDITNYVIRIMKKFGSSDLPQYEVMEKIELWLSEQKTKIKPRGWNSLEDRADCMKVFANAADDLAGAMAYAQHISNVSSPLKLLTGHGAKGLEFPHVYFLDNSLCKRDAQDPNIRYVIITRAKEYLTYIDSANFIDGE